MTQGFRDVADHALGVAVSVFTLCAEDRSVHEQNPMLARELVMHEDPVVVGQALAFVCKLLADYMTPAQVVAEKNALIERVVGK